MRGLGAVFARRTIMKYRPAIVAARALVLACAYSSLIILLLLTTLGHPVDSNQVVPLAVVFGVSALGAVWVIRSRARPHQARTATHPVDLFLDHVAVLSALALLPTIAGFVCFFVGGGFTALGIGLVTTWGLLYWLCSPDRSLVQIVAQAAGVSDEEMWDELLDPDPVDRPA